MASSSFAPQSMVARRMLADLKQRLHLMGHENQSRQDGATASSQSQPVTLSRDDLENLAERIALRVCARLQGDAS